MAPMVLVFALFMLKRAVRAGRKTLKKASFILMALACLKMSIFDIQSLRPESFCNAGDLACHDQTGMLIETLGFILLVGSGYLLHRYYGIYMNKPREKPQTPEEANVPFWANVSMATVVLMVIWQLAPWVGFLTIGSIPAIFLALPWQVLAVANLALLLGTFWRAENCVWDYDVLQKKNMGHLNKTWTAKDTLWMAVFIYLITLALSYVAHDVMSVGAA